MSEHVVMAIYAPKEGKEEELLELIRGHVPALRALGLASDRPAQLLKTFDGSAYIEIFAWANAEASSKAHETPEVQAIWGPMMEIADFPALKDLEEGQHRFPHFAPVDGVVA